jgi:pimeloyl-ACP methyl ester carboxylesterase
MQGADSVPTRGHWRPAAVAKILGTMHQTIPVDGFRLAYERIGRGPAVLLLHGWPGDRTDYRDVVRLVSPAPDVVVPDLRGFGKSDKHRAGPVSQYSADTQARSVVGLIEELALDRPVIGGYDIGSRIDQTVASGRPDLIRALVISPPLPGVGDRILNAQAQREFWYQPFHQLDLAEHLIDGRPEAVRQYLRHFWTHWSGPGFHLTDNHLDHWYRCTPSLAPSPPPSVGTARAPTRSPDR